jgi:hypothetical protein
MCQTKGLYKTKTHISCSIAFFLFPGNRAVYEVKWKNFVQPDRPQMLRRKCGALHNG